MPEQDEREKLSKVIRDWNQSREDLLEISQPDQNLEFHGVMRFHHEGDVGGNVATKCLRVCSNSSARDIVQTLSEKLRPDMKMLTESYSLYEIQNKKERKLAQNERPLVVQLNWNAENREGRFVLKRDKESFQENRQEKEKSGMIQNFKRTLSSRKDKKTEKNKSKDNKRSAEKPQNRNNCGSDHETKHQSENKHSVTLDPPVLPFEIRVRETSEEAFLSAVIHYTNSSTVHFKLSPAYILYAVGRLALRRLRRPGQTHGVTSTADKMVAMTRKVIQRQQSVAGGLTFWMANASELLNFFKQDKDLSPLTQQSQLDLSHLVYQAYSFLLRCLQTELTKHLPTFLMDPEQQGLLPHGIEKVLNTLMNTMSLLRRCRVNPALTIQLFSQLLHFISSWLFNRLMSPEADGPGLRSHYWGAALRQRLSAIEGWAERQGLERAADCHLGHVVQATALLTMNKYSTREAKDVQTTCFKLNSVQLRKLLVGYSYANAEPHIPSSRPLVPMVIMKNFGSRQELIDAAVTAAEASADTLIRGEGRSVELEESLHLNLPFLLPEGGYSCDTVRGIPPGLWEFLEPICRKGLCSLTQTQSRGDWTVFFKETSPPAENTYLEVNRESEIVTVTLRKPLNSGMGVSIVAAKGAQQDELGIYIKSIVKGGAAETNGGLTAGDQLLSVDGQSLLGLSQERAAAIIVQTGPVVTLRVAKFGASYHGLDFLLNGPALGHENGSKTKGDAAVRSGSVAPDASEKLRGSGRTKNEQMMQRNRQLYRSSPNVTKLGLEDRDVQSDERRNVTSVSTVNLCTETFHREYLTLPAIKSQDKKTCESLRPQQVFVPLRPSGGRSSIQRNFMRQAHSQENLCVDSGRPLLDNKQNTWMSKQTMGHPSSSSFPIRSCVSTHDIISDTTSPKQHRQSSRTSGAGVWKTPFSQHPTPTPSMQPIRIDIPITRAVSATSKPPLLTFQSPSAHSVKMGQILQINGHRPSSQNQAEHIYSTPISAVKKLPPPSPTKKLPPPSLTSQQIQRSSMSRGHAVKPQVSITPTKHVSFQEPPTHQRWTPALLKQKDELEEEEEKEKKLEALEQEVHRLQATVRRSAEENDRLRKLSLEWQFEKRLREIQQRGDEDDDGEGLDMMVTIQQLDTRGQTRRSSVGKQSHQTGSCVSRQEDRVNTGQRSSGRTEDICDMKLKENPAETMKNTAAPEKLTFRERQRLFSLATSA